MNSNLAVKAFIVKDNKLLILKRSPNDVQKPSVWEIPGGRLEVDEDPKTGLIREVKEETNIDIEIFQPINVNHFTRDDGIIITMIIFLCKPLSEEVKISYEHSDFKWINIENSKEKLTKFFHEEIDIYNELL